ncbi:phosphatidylserine decarboxylase-domain-containing protein [Aspergillus coremiiformis]|uniref:Phosphatidylserine decarboxylase-domain-containing protein n=1 Tax=Aspergillus coremiiformis TaxID=138285 RepID=A0A5N6YXL1_9EURO|nr:phosphatidylserine decarboxylase-domain-containing protein [Aspergillus coremiiformis]
MASGNSIPPQWAYCYDRPVDDAAKVALPLHPIIQAFQKTVQESPDLRRLASAMLTEEPDMSPYITDLTATTPFGDFDHLLHLLNYSMQKVVPPWAVDDCYPDSVGSPMYMILQWAMATPSGRSFVLNEEVQVHMKNVQTYWIDEFLSTSASARVLVEEPDGWLSAEGRKAIEDETNLDPNHTYTFEELFGHRRTDGEHWGYKSWDDFFTRPFAEPDKSRPVYAGDDGAWVVSACESRPYALQSNIKDRDTFWLKGPSYSLSELLDHEDAARQFVGGSVYQAFLSPTSYHRWHSPVDGTITKVKLIEGAMFSETTATGWTDPYGFSPVSQKYITDVATRALIYIEAPGRIGLMCFVGVGMADASSCEVTVKEGDYVSKGQEIGAFHHGGSAYCLLFRNGVNLTWVTDVFPSVHRKNLPVRGALAHLSTGALIVRTMGVALVTILDEEVPVRIMDVGDMGVIMDVMNTGATTAVDILDTVIRSRNLS